MPKAVLFDVDGTLVTFKFDAMGARAALIREVADAGFDPTGMDTSMPTTRILDAASALAGPRFGELRARLYEVLDRFEEESSRDAVVLEGVRETLDLLKARSVRLGVYTNSGRKAAFAVLERGSLLPYFELVQTREDVEVMKPHPSGILRALARFSLPREDLCYVGDAPLDIAAARAAGVKVVSVATGVHTPDRLREEGAETVIMSLAGLPSALGL